MIAKSPVHRRNAHCRLCGNAKLRLGLSIEASPIADAYVPPSKLHEDQPRFPMDLHQCEACGHVQLIDVVSPDILFKDYIYNTADSASLVEHFRGYVEALAERFSPKAGSLAVDIGSNDGTVLGFWKQRGLRVLGVDPAENIAAAATLAGLPTRCAYFDEALGHSLRQELGEAAIVTANNVFAHADDLQGILKGIRALLAEDGVFVFEVSYLVDIIEKKLFDTIYHEHLCYHSIAPLQKFFESNDMVLFDVAKIPTKGGSIRVFAQRRQGKHPVSDTVSALLRHEREIALETGAPLRDLQELIRSNKSQLLDQLSVLRAKGARIAGFGASATVTTLLTQFELAPLLDYLVDDNPKRHGLYSPHFHIPVLSSQILHERPPDCVVVLAWQYATPIINRHRAFAQNGRFFLMPMPELKRIG